MLRRKWFLTLVLGALGCRDDAVLAQARHHGRDLRAGRVK